MVKKVSYSNAFDLKKEHRKKDKTPDGAMSMKEKTKIINKVIEWETKQKKREQKITKINKLLAEKQKMNIC